MFIRPSRLAGDLNERARLCALASRMLPLGQPLNGFWMRVIAQGHIVSQTALSLSHNPDARGLSRVIPFVPTCVCAFPLGPLLASHSKRFLCSACSNLAAAASISARVDIAE